MRCLVRSTILAISGLSFLAPAADGGTQPQKTTYSALWLDYRPLTPPLREEWAGAVRHVFCPGSSPILRNARDEWTEAAKRMTGIEVKAVDSIEDDGTVVIGTLDRLKPMLPQALIKTIETLKAEGHVIATAKIEGKNALVVASRDEPGVLYGTFHLLRRMQTGLPVSTEDLVDEPAIRMRMLNHWDNLNGGIERGYGGRSLWRWDELPAKVDPRCRDYARLCASIGINGVVLNNVNSDPRILRSDYLAKVAALAEVFRGWGIRTYLSANFAAPMHPSDTPDRMKHWGGIGDLDTADPLDPAVRGWWKAKADEIYAAIPDFGGFLVKANSEGMAGPRDYDRSHVEGANMLADALAPHGGSLIWRAFVYGGSKDRAMDAYREFKPLDGKFRDNVFIQVKNGPLDFQPCEPFTPLFGGMPETNLSMELQIAKEYLGHSTTLAYLGPMWSTILGSDTYAKGPVSTVAKVIDGSLDGHKRSCIAGVANTGSGDEWCGSVFNQANWYAYGRLAWDPRLDPGEIADEWIRMSFRCDADTRGTIREMMMRSYDAYVDYTMPLGLNFLIAMGDHFSPSPKSRVSYHKADAEGLGFERTTDGSGYVNQYHPELRDRFNDIETTPMKYLLWFHHVPWGEKLSTGRTLWEELCFRYDRGVAEVDRMAETWHDLDGKVDPEVHASVMKKLLAEKAFARKWRDECVRYFSGFAAPGDARDEDDGSPNDR